LVLVVQALSTLEVAVMGLILYLEALQPQAVVVVVET
jgi:hypothetical protein